MKIYLILFLTLFLISCGDSDNSSASTSSKPENKPSNAKGICDEEREFIRGPHNDDLVTIRQTQWGHYKDSTFYRKYDIDDNAHISIKKAWDNYSTKGRGVTVAVIDSELDTSLVAFSGLNIETYDVLTDSSDVSHRGGLSHGTPVTGIIASQESPNKSIGVAPEIDKLIFIKIPMGKDTPVALILKAFVYAKNKGADVMNLSFSLALSDIVKSTLDDFALNARGGKGGIIIIASGNKNAYIGGDIAGYDKGIAIGSSSSLNMRSTYSSYGRTLDFLAPGGDFLGISTVTADNDLRTENNYMYADFKYKRFFGTSAAAPMATGVVSLMLSLKPNLTREQVYEIFKNTADKIGTKSYDSNGHNICYGYGKINAYKALREAYNSY